MAVSQSLTLTQSSQSVSGNYSKVRILWKSTQSGQSVNGFTRTAKYYVSINGGAETEYSVSYTLPKSTTKTIVDTTITVNHKADGTGTVKVRTWMDTDISAGVVTQSETLELDTIPRATTPAVSSSSVDMGGKVTINTPRASSSFTHDLAYSFAGAAYVSIATGVGTSYSWTTPDLASKIPSATSGTVTIRCITKSGSTTIGTKTVTMTLKVPTSVVPTISAVATVEATSGLAAQFGAFIKGKSKIKATITAAGAKGSTIKSYSTTFNGRTYTGSSWTSPAVSASGSLSLVTTVTDTRGRTAKKTTTITVLDYSKPAINALQVYRVNAEGGADQDGVYIAVRYKYSVTSLGGKNTARMVVEYKLSTETEWSELLTGSALSADTTALPASPTFSTDYQYDVRLSLSDYFGAATPYTARLESGAVILDIRADGLGLGLFTTATREGVDFGASPKGAVLGLWEATAEIPENGRFSDYLLPGVYNVPRNDTMATISDRPCDRAGTLRVSSGIGTKKVAGAYAYIVQEFHSYHNMEPIYRRHLISDATGAFEAGPWRAITFRGQKVLWSGGKYMTADHQADLSEPVSQQDNGIVLVFSTYQDGAAIDANFNCFFVPKQFVSILGGYGTAYQMNTVNFNTVGAKYLYIHDTYIKGNENNNLSGTATSGIVFNNAMYVLRYVLGV